MAAVVGVRAGEMVEREGLPHLAVFAVDQAAPATPALRQDRAAEAEAALRLLITPRRYKGPQVVVVALRET